MRLDLPGVLLEWGQRDHWIPIEFARRLKDGFEKAELVVYPDAGHVPMEELPDITVDDADRFLARPD